MIQMAEKRGLFGDESSTSGKSKSTKNPKKKMEKDPLPKSKKKMKTIEVTISFNITANIFTTEIVNSV